MKGEAFASDDSTYLQLDYELVCRIMDGLEVGRQDEGRRIMSYEIGRFDHGHRIMAEAGKGKRSCGHS